MKVFREQFIELKSLQHSERKSKMKQLLQEAKQNYNKIYSEGLRLHKESEGTFIDYWERAFC